LKKLFISIGCFLGNGFSWTEIINEISKLNVDGIEFVMGNKRDFLDFKLNSQNLDLFNSYPVNSIHLPWYQTIYKKQDNTTKKILEKTEKLSSLINSELVVIHPDVVDNFSIFKDYSFELGIENLSFGHKFTNPDEINTLLEANKELSFVLDISHALENKIPLTNFLKLKDRISEIHLSSATRKIQHAFVSTADKTDLENIKKALISNTIILETDIQKENLNKLPKEISFVRGLL
jgi:sugar phosphate isomerase/epimerase